MNHTFKILKYLYKNNDGQYHKIGNVYKDKKIPPNRFLWDKYWELVKNGYVIIPDTDSMRSLIGLETYGYEVNELSDFDFRSLKFRITTKGEEYIDDKNKKEKSYVISVVGLFAVIIAALIGRSYVSRSQKYLELGLEYRPRIEIVGTPQLEHVKLLNEPLKDAKIIDTLTAEVESKLNVTFSLHITNIGNEVGKIFSHILLDTVYGDDFIRGIITDKRMTKNYTLLEMHKYSFYDKIELNPKDTVKIRINLDINFPEESEFVIHYVILYFNSYNNLFDSYYWIRFDLKELRMELIYNEKHEFIGLKFDKDFIKFKDMNMISKLYSYNEKRRVIKNLSSLK